MHIRVMRTEVKDSNIEIVVDIIDNGSIYSATLNYSQDIVKNAKNSGTLDRLLTTGVSKYLAALETASSIVGYSFDYEKEQNKNKVYGT